MPTTPPTFVASTIVTADDLNLLRDAILELQVRADGSDYMAVQVSKTTQSISNSTDTEIIFSGQAFDIGGAWSSGTDIIVPASWIPAGSTSIAVRTVMRTKWAANTTGSRHTQSMLNGVAYGSVTVRAESAGVTEVIVVEVAPVVEVGDVITMVVTQSSGGSLNVEYAQCTVERAGVTA